MKKRKNNGKKLKTSLSCLMIMKRGKKAMFFSTDALVALLIILLVILIVYPAIKYSSHKTELPGDTIILLSSLKIGEINNTYIQNLIASGEITDLNKSVLEQIGDFYVNDNPRAKELSYEILSTLNTNENIGIWYGDDLLASKNSSSYETSTNVEVERQIISGIEKGKASKGFVAKAWLKKILEKETSLFVMGDSICGGWKTYSWGEYCSSTANLITYNVNLPVNVEIENATWLVEGSWVNQYNRLYVNGNQIFAGTINYYRIFDITSYINPGQNTVTLNSTMGGDDGASHIVVNYNVPDLQTFHHPTIFPFYKVKTNSVLHHEKSIFIPSQISYMNVSVNTSRDVTLYFRKGSQTITIGKKYPQNNLVVFSDTEIKNVLSANSISYSSLNNEYFFFILDIGKDTVGQLTVLGENSFVYVESSEISMPYGTIDITQEIPITYVANNLQSTFYRFLKWTFFLPVNAIPIIADWQFGWLSSSSEATEQEARANSISLYDSPPDPFIHSFSRFGYTPSKASGIFKEGENNFTLQFGSGYGVSNEASYGYLTYFIRSYVNYGEAKEKAQGGTRIVEFEDGSSKSLEIGNSADSWDPSIDAIDDAIERLLTQLDSNSNGKIDLIIDQNSFDIESLDISGVPYIWSTEIQVRKWD